MLSAPAPRAGQAQKPDRVKRIGMLTDASYRGSACPTRLARYGHMGIGRREIIFMLCGVTATCRTTRAQQTGSVAVVGILAMDLIPIDTFREALNNFGYVHGKNVRLERAYAMGRSDRLAGLVADLVNSKVDVILSVGTEATLAAKRATTTIPIVMCDVGDPVASDVLSNLARPEANITGFSSLAVEREVKRLELLKEMVPALSRGAIFTSPTNPYNRVALESLRRGADILHVSLTSYEVHDMTTLASALDEQLKARPDALIVLSDAFMIREHVRIVRFAIENKLPSAYSYSEAVEQGGLIAYTTNYRDLFRRAASYVDKILKGTKPADLPVQQPTKFDLLINLNTARALGIEIPSPFCYAPTT